jgi:hypothetical protein
LVRDAEYILPSRHAREKVIHAERRRIGHPATETAGAKSASLARERHDSAVPTVLASYTKEAVHEDAATKVGL